jgi:hypothetical protein
MLVTTLPYLFAYFRQGNDWVFTGFLFGVEDGNSYIAKMLSGWNGAWTFKTPYTNFPQTGVLIYFPFILLGKLASPPGLHEQLIILYQFFRLVGILFYCFGCYWFVSVFIQEIKLRRLGISLAVFGGGLGWLLLLLGRSQIAGSLPIEFYSPETFGFLEIYGLPHLAIARGSLFFALSTFLRSNHWNDAIKTGGWLVLATIMQPLTGLVGCTVITVYLIVTGAWQLGRRIMKTSLNIGLWEKTFFSAIIAGFIVSPLVLYDAYIVLTDPFMKAWDHQDKIFSPNPVHYLLAFLIVIPFAVVGIKNILKNDPWKGCLLMGWLFIFPFLAYIPLNIQRRLPEGIWMVWIILALLGVSQIKFNPKIRWTFSLAFPSTIILLLGSTISIIKPSEPVYIPRFDVNAFQQIQTNPNHQPTVLAAYSTSNAMPAWVPVTVLIGHGPESIGLDKMQPQVEAFYQATTSENQRRDFIMNNHIDLIYWGPAEKALGDWNPYSSSLVEEVYHSAEVSIFRVAIYGQALSLK